jgi:hypothetical protein
MDLADSDGKGQPRVVLIKQSAGRKARWKVLRRNRLT